jgi:membrane protein implicated in regulation of membrane protease activity
MKSATAGFVHVTLAGAVSFSAIAFMNLELWYKVLGGTFGLVLGAWAGRNTSRRLDARVDRRGGLVLYVADTGLYGLLLPLALISLSPLGFGWALGTVARSAGLQAWLQGMLCVVSTGWFAHEVVVARQFRRIAARAGELHVQWFYAPSVVGPEAMLGRTGVVTTECSPVGYVRLGSELWRAESLDGARLPVGQPVVVRRFNGLAILVEATQPTGSDRPLRPTSGTAVVPTASRSGPSR